MTISNQLYFNVFSAYKARYKQKANTIALVYLWLLEVSAMLMLGVFFSVFFRQMNVSFMSSNGAWTLFVISAFIIYFKNWIQYSGKKRNVLRANATRKKSLNYNVVLLWMLPVAFIMLSVILLKAF